MVLCFSSKDVTASKFEKGVVAWEQAAALVRAREKAVSDLEGAIETAKKETLRVYSTMSKKGGAQSTVSLNSVERLSCPVLQTTCQVLSLAAQLKGDFGSQLEYEGLPYPPDGHQTPEQCISSLVRQMESLAAAIV